MEEHKNHELEDGQGLPPRSEFHQKKKSKFRKNMNAHLLFTKIMYYLFLIFIAFVFIYYLNL